MKNIVTAKVVPMTDFNNVYVSQADRNYLQILDAKTLSQFEVEDLKFLISGTTTVDVSEWRQHTEYQNGKYYETF